MALEHPPETEVCIGVCCGGVDMCMVECVLMCVELALNVSVCVCLCVWAVCVCMCVHACMRMCMCRLSLCVCVCYVHTLCVFCMCELWFMLSTVEWNPSFMMTLKAKKSVIFV